MSESPADWDLFSSYAGLLSLACLSIYAGSFASLEHYPQADAGAKAGQHREEEEEEEEEEVYERMSSADAWLFPIMGSVVLFGLYLVVKYLGKEWINWLLGWYFSAAGVGSVWKTSTSLARYLMGETRWKSFDKIKLFALKGHAEIFSLSFRTVSLSLLPVAAVPAALYAFLPAARGSVLLTNVLALSFAHSALAVLKLDAFRTGCILLAGLFLYDVWWVFGTEVMVKVATSLDVPIKLLWPKSRARGHTLLGLGDVVVPGVFVALALRYDAHRARAARGAFAKPYFWATLGAYAAGLATTMGVMHVFRAAQPALLYLSPACILAFAITALIRGELQEAWGWTDAPPERPHREQTEPEKTAAAHQNGAAAAAAAAGGGAPPHGDSAQAQGAGEGAPADERDGKAAKRKGRKKAAAAR